MTNRLLVPKEEGERGKAARRPLKELSDDGTEFERSGKCIFAPSDNKQICHNFVHYLLILFVCSRYAKVPTSSDIFFDGLLKM